MSKSPTDFNDMAAIKGQDSVRAHLLSALDSSSPAPLFESDRPTIIDIIRRYALAMPDGKVWDSHSKKLLKKGSFKDYLGVTLYKEWLNHDDRRTVELDDVLPEIAAAQAEGVEGLADALERYVYLNPSSTAWDKKMCEVVALNDLRYAIADCFDMWVKHSQRKEIPKSNLVFDPTQSVDPSTHINMFRGLPLTPNRDYDKCRCIRAMLYHLCNQDEIIFGWLRNWLAYPLQNVGAKMSTAVLVHSDVHGSGKSFFFDGVMREVYGEYCRTFGQQQLESQYNDWISQTLFGVFEEVLSRSQRYSHTGTIKQMITGITFRVEKKYISGWEESNHMNCVFLSNEVQPMPVEPFDRRILVIWPQKKLPDELQRGVDDELRNGGAAAFYHWLLASDTTDFSPHTKPPMTNAKKRLIDFGRPGWEVFYEEWQSGELDVPYCSCLIKQLFKVFERWCTQRRENCVSQNRFSGFIATKEKRRRDVNYKSRTLGTGKGVFFVIHKCPSDKNQEEWLGGCIDAFAEIEHKIDAQGAEE